MSIHNVCFPGEKKIYQCILVDKAPCLKQCLSLIKISKHIHCTLGTLQYEKKGLMSLIVSALISLKVSST